MIKSRKKRMAFFCYIASITGLGATGLMISLLFPAMSRGNYNTGLLNYTVENIILSSVGSVTFLSLVFLFNSLIHIYKKTCSSRHLITILVLTVFFVGYVFIFGSRDYYNGETMIVVLLTSITISSTLSFPFIFIAICRDVINDLIEFYS